MELNAIGALGGLANTQIEGAKAAAGGAMFSSLDAIQRKIGHAASHVVNEAAKSKQDKDLKNACKEFEAYFLDMMYRQMRKTVPDGGLFKKSNAIEIFEDMRDTEYMKQMANAGGIGIADMMYKQLAPQVLAKEAIEEGKG